MTARGAGQGCGEAENMLRAILDLPSVRTTLLGLDMGIGASTDAGKVWIAARAFVLTRGGVEADTRDELAALTAGEVVPAKTGKSGAAPDPRGFYPDQYADVAARLREHINDDQFYVVASNNHNVILAALDQCGDER